MSIEQDQIKSACKVLGLWCHPVGGDEVTASTTCGGYVTFNCADGGVVVSPTMTDNHSRAVVIALSGLQSELAEALRVALYCVADPTGLEAEQRTLAKYDSVVCAEKQVGSGT